MRRRWRRRNQVQCLYKLRAAGEAPKRDPASVINIVPTFCLYPFRKTAGVPQGRVHCVLGFRRAPVDGARESHEVAVILFQDRVLQTVLCDWPASLHPNTEVKTGLGAWKIQQG